MSRIVRRCPSADVVAGRAEHHSACVREVVKDEHGAWISTKAFTLTALRSCAGLLPPWVTNASDQGVWHIRRKRQPCQSDAGWSQRG